LAQPIEATLFTLLIITTALALRYALQLNGLLLPDLLFNALTPWLTSSNTLWFVLSVILLSKLLWFIGFNGNSLILISLMPMMVVFNAENLFAYQNDKALPYLFTTGFLFFELGVLPLATAILLFSKNNVQRIFPDPLYPEFGDLVGRDLSRHDLLLGQQTALCLLSGSAWLSGRLFKHSRLESTDLMVCLVYPVYADLLAFYPIPK
jgi:hypothetical protein